MSQLLEQIHQAARYIQMALDDVPRAGLILGSGLGIIANSLDGAIHIPYHQIPHFPIPSVEGHSGNIVIGKFGKTPVIALQGRIHYYEHHDMQEVTFPLRVLIELGIKYLIITNACGGIRADFYPGALMVIRDHINLMGTNPLAGKNNDQLGPRFPDMSLPYSAKLMAASLAIARDLKIELSEGVYCAVSGPNYASRAELKMFRFSGADAIGMSTVPEVIVANHADLPVLGISCITDMAIPESLEPLTHSEVIQVANFTKPILTKLISTIIARN